jgi:hypothetical protein
MLQASTLPLDAPLSPAEAHPAVLTKHRDTREAEPVDGFSPVPALSFSPPAFCPVGRFPLCSCSRILLNKPGMGRVTWKRFRLHAGGQCMVDGWKRGRLVLAQIKENVLTIKAT